MTKEDNIQVNNLKNTIKSFIFINNINKHFITDLKEYIQYGLPQTEEVKEIVNRINQLKIQ